MFVVYSHSSPSITSSCVTLISLTSSCTTLHYPSSSSMNLYFITSSTSSFHYCIILRSNLRSLYYVISFYVIASRHLMQSFIIKPYPSLHHHIILRYPPHTLPNQSALLRHPLAALMTYIKQY